MQVGLIGIVLLMRKKIKVSGLGMDINLLVKSAEDIVIQATALNGSLKYLDEWTGTRNLSTYVTYGDLTVIEPSNNEGNLELNISGMINVNRKKILRGRYICFMR